MCCHDSIVAPALARALTLALLCTQQYYGTAEAAAAAVAAANPAPAVGSGVPALRVVSAAKWAEDPIFELAMEAAAAEPDGITLAEAAAEQRRVAIAQGRPGAAAADGTVAAWIYGDNKADRWAIGGWGWECGQCVGDA